MYHISLPPPHPNQKKQQTKSTQTPFASRIPPILSPQLPQGIPSDPTSTTFNLKVSPGESGTLRVQQQTLKG